MTVGVVTVVRKDDFWLGPSSTHLQPISTAFVLEGCFVTEDIKNLHQAVCLVFGLTYALHLDYLKCITDTLNCIRRVMLGSKKVFKSLLHLTKVVYVNVGVQVEDRQPCHLLPEGLFPSPSLRTSDCRYTNIHNMS